MSDFQVLDRMIQEEKVLSGSWGTSSAYAMLGALIQESEDVNYGYVYGGLNTGRWSVIWTNV